MEFQMVPLKFHSKYLTHILKDMDFIHRWKSVFETFHVHVFVKIETNTRIRKCMYLLHYISTAYKCIRAIWVAREVGKYTTWGPFHKYGLTLILAWISNHIHYKVWDEINNIFPNVNGATVDVFEWISNFVPHFPGHVLIHAGIKVKKS